MKKRLSHLVFYDGECGFCDQIVQLLLRLDKKELFVFAPLQGETAREILPELPDRYKNVDSLILVENYQSSHRSVYMQAKAAFRILWLLGGGWVLIGWLNFLPSFLFDWGYRLVARNRYRLFGQACLVPRADQKERFLP